jgi:hypothetical protein
MILTPLRTSFVFVAIVAFAVMNAAPVWSGGEADEHEHSDDDGPRFFGFVKDGSGRIIADAKVTAEIKGLGSVVTRTDKMGAYRMPGFGKHIAPNNITISCSKDGYKQLRAVRRSAPGTTAVTAVETECVLQRLGSK